MKLPQGKLLALDCGTRRTGVAISDKNQSIAFARPELEHRSKEECLVQIQKLLTEENIVAIVMGRPIKLDGTETEQTQKVDDFAEGLSAFGLPILMSDERLSSHFAGEEKDWTTQKHHDSRVAQKLLEIVLESQERASKA